MMLSDHSIKFGIQIGRIGIYPLDFNDIQPASVDLHLDHRFRRPIKPLPSFVLDPEVDNSNMFAPFTAQGPLRIEPGQFLLGATSERVKLGRDIAARVEGKSSLARLGLVVHVTGGFIDPGFDGPITLEMCNLAPMPIVLRPGMKVCQIAFSHMTTPAERPYGSPGLGSKYTDNDAGPTASKIHEEGS